MSGGKPSETEAEGLQASPSDSLVGSVIAERYRIDALLGVGGMGAVYRAEHVLMKKAVAVKVLHREMTAMDEVVKRFEREAIAAGRIDHPNVTVATDFGKLADGAFYLVLEYVPGKSLTDLLESDGPLPEGRAVFIAAQIAAGLGAAHAAGIVHRDLKPDNVMLIERGATRDFVKVLDFGIAKVSVEGVPGAQLTRIGAVFGTPAYMAPEQAAGQEVDHRADLYSLGLVLFEMLAGHAAFESSDLVSLLAKQLTEPPPPLPEHVSDEVRAIVTTLLEKDPALRIPSAAALLSALEAQLESAAVVDPAQGPGSSQPSFAGIGLPPRSPHSASSVSSASSTNSDSVVARTVLADGEPLSPSPLQRCSQWLQAGRSVAVFGRSVSRRLAGAAASGFLLVVLLVTALAPRPARPSFAEPRQERSPSRELEGILRKAEEGERSAIKALEARAALPRTAPEWMAIGKGHSRLGEHEEALLAFEHAVQQRPELAADGVMLRAVRRAADDDRVQRRALDFAAGPLGASGADVLFDVWASTVEKTETTALAKELLDREAVRNGAFRPLRVALELRRTTRCEEVKHLVVDALAVGDERAFRPLNQLSSRRGCGFLRLNDCYPCLRKDETLSDALKATQQRKGPRF